jgi:mono/diheme cytochrome c family protein
MNTKLKTLIFFFLITTIPLFLISCSHSNEEKPSDNIIRSDTTNNASHSLYMKNNSKPNTEVHTENMVNGMMSEGMKHKSTMYGHMMMNSGSGDNSISSSIEKLNNPLTNIAKASQEGQKIFRSYCASCHGADGKANTQAAEGLNPKPANLTLAAVQNQTDGEIYWKITNGKGAMPSFKSTLSKKQRWEIIDYIRTLSKKSN